MVYSQNQGSGLWVPQNAVQGMSEMFRAQSSARRSHSECLVADCANKAVKAHYIPRNLLKKHLSSEGKVIVLQVLPNGLVQPKSVGLQYSTLRFACQQHDAIFHPIDQDFDVTHVNLDLVLLRAVLREIVETRAVSRALEESFPPHPMQAFSISRLNNIHDELLIARDSLLNCIDGTRRCEYCHVVREVPTKCGVLGLSYAHGSQLAQKDFHPLFGEIRRTIDSRQAGPIWGFSVLPLIGRHVAVASYVEGTPSSRYFRDFLNLPPEDVALYVCSEVITFTENWVVNPSIWGRLRRKRQRSIQRAYNNIEQLITGEYTHTEFGDWWRRHGHTSPPRDLNFFDY